MYGTLRKLIVTEEESLDSRRFEMELCWMKYKNVSYLPKPVERIRVTAARKKLRFNLNKMKFSA